MAKHKNPTEAEVSDLIERLTDLSIEAAEMSDRIARSFGLSDDFIQPARLACDATGSAHRLTDFAHKLSIMVRHNEDRDRLKARLSAEVKGANVA